MTLSDRKFEMVYSAEELSRRMTELKEMGYSEGDIHLIARDEDALGAVGGKGNANTHAGGSIADKFKSIFSGESEIRKQLNSLGLGETTAESYEHEIRNGAILMYTDKAMSNHDLAELNRGGEPRNTAFVPFGRDVERDGEKFNDPKITDPDIQPQYGSADTPSEDEIYTRDVRREDQHGYPSLNTKLKDSRMDGETIHPTTDGIDRNEAALSEKEMDHEPPLAEDELNREDGINRRMDEQSPGVDPNLGPAPFGRDSEEEHLLDADFSENDHYEDTSELKDVDDGDNLDGKKFMSDDHRSDFEHSTNPRDDRKFHEEAEKKTATPPTPRLF